MKLALLLIEDPGHQELERRKGVDVDSTGEERQLKKEETNVFHQLFHFLAI